MLWAGPIVLYAAAADVEKNISCICCVTNGFEIGLDEMANESHRTNSK